MTTLLPSPRNTPPTTRALVFIFGLAVVVVVFALVTYALTPPEHRPELLGRFGTVFPTLVLLVPTVLAWVNGQEAVRQGEQAVRQGEQAKAEAAEARHIVEEIAETVINGHTTPRR